MNEHIVLLQNHPHDVLLFHNQQLLSPHDILAANYTEADEDEDSIIRRYISTTTGTSSTNMETTPDHPNKIHSTNTNSSSSTSRCAVVNLHAAYLDGCSIVMNHADTIHPYIAVLCQDLQNSFPHVYANVYLTPPSSQTVPAHADDRDVFIIQVVGCKLWTIYTNIPIPYPYPSEQVGKSTALPVPEQVLRGPILFQSILYPGDVLYIPRGYVHEAQCVLPTSTPPSTQPPSPPPPQQQQQQQQTSFFGSFHITIAIATHDWSLLGLLQRATSDLLSSTQLLPVDYRKAIDRQFGQHPTIGPRALIRNHHATSTDTTTSTESMHLHHDVPMVADEAVIQLQQQIDTVLQLFQREITVSNINEALYNKYKFHNQRALLQRNNMVQEYLRKQEQQKRRIDAIQKDDILTMVGYEAAQTMTLHSYIRAVTESEKKVIATHTEQEHRYQAFAHPTSSLRQPKPQGLHVREEIHDDIMAILQHVKLTPTAPNCYQVFQLRSLLQRDDDIISGNNVTHQRHSIPQTTSTGATITNYNLICDVTLLSMARRCVEFGAFAIVPIPIGHG
jgi:hypothetical protein